MKCPTCGDELKVITVRVPVPYLTSHMYEAPPPKVIGEGPMIVLHQWIEREEVCDCPRCQGGY